MLSRCRRADRRTAPQGGCDLVSDFAIRFPTDMFLATLNLPVCRRRGFFVGRREDLRGLRRQGAGRGGRRPPSGSGLLRPGVTDRAAVTRGTPRPTSSRGCSCPPSAASPIPREDIITICYTAMLAGLDTTRSALGFIFHHLARRRRPAAPAHRPARAVAAGGRGVHPALPAGLPWTAAWSRSDIDFHGLPLRKGDIVLAGPGLRQPRPAEVRRAALRSTWTASTSTTTSRFGAGLHRCLGMHLARHELVIARHRVAQADSGLQARFRSTPV